MAPKKTQRFSFYKSLLMDCVRREGSLSRTQLARAMRLRMPLITALTRELMDQGVLVEHGRAPAARGRKPVLLRLNNRHGFVVGLEFDLYRITATAVDVCGRVAARRHLAMPRELTQAAIVEALYDAVEAAIGASGFERRAFKGIGAADPGVVDTRAGIARFCSLLPDWREVPVRDLLADRFGVPVLLDENTRAKTLCEHRAGAGQGVRDLLYVDIGSGIGCGLILDGRLYRGHREIAGELGHVRVLENGPVCQCGGSGCLETVAAYPALIRQAQAALRDGAHSLMAAQADTLTMADFFDAARRGDRLALDLWDRALRYLGEAVANAATLLNPERIVMNFNLPQADERLWLAPLRTILDRRVIRLPGQELPLRAAQAGSEAGAWGAAMLVLDRLFDVPLEHAGARRPAVRPARTAG